MAKKKPAEEQPFETNLKKLEDVVEKLESGSVSLDKALELFQEGKNLARACECRLKEVELKIQKLVESEDGEDQTEDFEPQVAEKDAES
ncbi:MAG: exodeoxyribonuclease VII small subunit [Candidatus Sumerlaeia bacterium]